EPGGVIQVGVPLGCKVPTVPIGPAIGQGGGANDSASQGREGRYLLGNLGPDFRPRIGHACCMNEHAPAPCHGPPPYFNGLWSMYQQGRPGLLDGQSKIARGLAHRWNDHFVSIFAWRLALRSPVSLQRTVAADPLRR